MIDVFAHILTPPHFYQAMLKYDATISVSTRSCRNGY